MRRPTIFLSLMVLLSNTGCFGQPSNANSANPAQEPNRKNTPLAVEVKEIDNGWQLLRDGQPYYIKGAGGSDSLERLAKLGANSVRTWGVNAKTKSLLDKAHANGLSVTVGIWLEHVDKGFDYTNDTACSRQEDAVLAAVKKYKDHPAVLAWGIGNEVENGFEDNLAIYKHIESIAAKVKKIDPYHPTMSVLAEMGSSKVESTLKYCPSIDIIGINSYAGAPSLVERYRKLNPAKPFVVAEFGPFGTWESPTNEHGMVIEKTSTQKAATYANSYKSFLKDQKVCLGSYVFLWGQKQETTATWFGMLTDDGHRTASVDAISKAWTGKTAANVCPVIDEFKISKTDLKPGETFHAAIKTSDAENDPVATKWFILQEADKVISGGDFQATPPAFPKSVINSDAQGAEFSAPLRAGLYRVYAISSDNRNGAATANAPFRVLPGNTKTTGRIVKLPFELDRLQQDLVKAQHGPSFKFDTACKENPKSGDNCFKFTYNGDGESEVFWRCKPDEASAANGIDLTGATKLSFWVRGQKGGERIKFGIGSLEENRPETAFKEIGLALGGGWMKLDIDISKLDLRAVNTVFYLNVINANQPITFFLDGIEFQK